MQNFDELRSLIEFLRRCGVNSYSTPALSLVLGEVPVESVKEIDNAVKPGQPRKGKDGLTAEQQFEFYGRIIDGE